MYDTAVFLPNFRIYIHTRVWRGPNDELYAAANAIAQLQSHPLSGIRTVATGDLADAG